jgi:hypothetical protein
MYIAHLVIKFPAILHCTENHAKIFKVPPYDLQFIYFSILVLTHSSSWPLTSPILALIQFSKDAVTHPVTGLFHVLDI